MSDLFFLHCDHYPHCTARIDKRFDSYHSLQWMESGSVELFYDEEKSQLCAEQDTTWFWPAFPGPRIRFGPSRGGDTWNHRYAAFTGPRVEQWKRAGLWTYRPQLMSGAARHRLQFDELLYNVRRGGLWGRRRAVHTLEGVLLELAEARSSNRSEPLWLVKARDFLLQTDEFSPNYAHLAHELGMGLSTLRRNFKKATGLSLHEARLQHRLDQARRLLGETNMPLKQIATRLGYQDVYFFSAQFKKLSGVSPAAYRKSRQE